MKKSFLVFLAAASLITACQQAPEGKKADTAEKQEAAIATGSAYIVDTTTSLIAWVGAKPTGKHNGDFKLAGGSFAVENGAITGGNFIIDVASLKDHDLEPGEFHDKLEGHLKSADFLDVAKHPTAKFEITKIDVLQNDTSGTHTISGNLTLRDSTKNVTFPATIAVSDNDLKASANFNIDRTQWGLHYGNDKSLGDKFIHPEVNLTLNITARK